MPRATWLSTVEAAEFFGVSKATIDDWCYRRRIPFSKPGRDRRFRLSDCERLMEETAVPAEVQW